MRTILTGITLILIGAGSSGHTQILGDSNFSRAFHEGMVIHYDAPSNIDWPSMAPSDLSRITESAETVKHWEMLEARRNMFDNSEFVYEAPVPDELIDSRHYLIGADGITILVLTHATGTVRFTLHSREQRITARTDYGKITAEARNRMEEGGGFVFSDPVRVPRQVAASDLDIQDLIQNSALDRERGPESGDVLSAQEILVWKIQKQYTFAVDGEKAQYAFIQWATTGVTFESMCTYRYAIVALVPRPRVIATSNYGCDI